MEASTLKTLLANVRKPLDGIGPKRHWPYNTLRKEISSVQSKWTKKISYRENDDKPKNICIRNNLNTAASQTDTSACCDTDMTEIQCTIRRGNIGINCEQALIKSLENGIASLERLLQQKQEIIDRQLSENKTSFKNC